MTRTARKFQTQSKLVNHESQSTVTNGATVGDILKKGKNKLETLKHVDGSIKNYTNNFCSTIVIEFTCSNKCNIGRSCEDDPNVRFVDDVTGKELLWLAVRCVWDPCVRDS